MENFTEVGSGIEGANVYSWNYPPVMEETRKDTSCDEAMLSLNRWHSEDRADVINGFVNNLLELIVDEFFLSNGSS